MKIAILLKSGPCTDEADRALQTAADMLAQGHTVSLFLLQEAVRFCCLPLKCPESVGLKESIGHNLEVHVLTRDAELRGIDNPSIGRTISNGTYDSLIELLESCDRIIGIL
ncbi:MAG: hypothetical protein COS92_01870 [Desulfobacterales bacterium CG07_land_8_20_14_0_80_52_14]|nr:MAG: hypothetical protein COX20_04545 [Desulfobacterales bacterium CG23_combo_of_CG06-09_8_20_14_all_52_9]PIU50315.1 MAG: hypothetical protein COS92_01870 [Desulfobacterales bacterium CG07_land_8_20_14_0_80_52_14]